MSKNPLTSLEVMQIGPVIPVLVINDVNHAVPLARALIAGGVRVLEVTLRTSCALESIAQIAEEVPEAILGAGTITNAGQYSEAESAGAKFIISPGVTDSLLNQAHSSAVPLLPGICTVSELMMGKEAGINAFKFFPAEANGGIQALKAVGGPFADVCFCPTGGITPDNALSYLALPNVVCVGGSWLATAADLNAGRFERITELARLASTLCDNSGS